MKQHTTLYRCPSAGKIRTLWSLVGRCRTIPTNRIAIRNACPHLRYSIWHRFVDFDVVSEDGVVISCIMILGLHIAEGSNSVHLNYESVTLTFCIASSCEDSMIRLPGFRAHGIFCIKQCVKCRFEEIGNPWWSPVRVLAVMDGSELGRLDYCVRHSDGTSPNSRTSWFQCVAISDEYKRSDTTQYVAYTHESRILWRSVYEQNEQCVVILILIIITVMMMKMMMIIQVTIQRFHAICLTEKMLCHMSHVKNVIYNSEYPGSWWRYQHSVEALVVDILRTMWRFFPRCQPWES